MITIYHSRYGVCFICLFVSSIFTTPTSPTNQSKSVPNSGPQLNLKRDVLDTLYGWRQCWGADRTTGSPTECTCKAEYGTVMSKSGDEWECRTPAEVECDYSLGVTNKTNVYVIKNTTDSVKILPSGGGNFSMKGLSIWNRRFGKSNESTGQWDDVTDVASRFFTLDCENSSLSIQNLTLDTWKGHLVKFDLGGGRKCTLMKVKGPIQHPIDVEKFKHTILYPTISTTTETPTTTATTATATVMTTISTVKGSTTTATTTTAWTSYSTSITTTLWSTTTEKGKKYGPLKSKGPTIGIVLGTLLLLALVVTVPIFVHRRRARSMIPTDSSTDDICIENIHLTT